MLQVVSLAKDNLPAGELPGAVVRGRGVTGVSEVGRNQTFRTLGEEAPGFNSDI